MNPAGVLEDWNSGIRETKCVVCKRLRPPLVPEAVTPSTLSIATNLNSSNQTPNKNQKKHNKPYHQPNDIDQFSTTSILSVSPIRSGRGGGRGFKTENAIGVAVKYPLQLSQLGAASFDDSDSDSEEDFSKLLYATPRVIKNKKTGVPEMPDVTLSPCKEWSLWTSSEMKEMNFKLARMIHSYESDFTKLRRVTLCNCKLDPIDCSIIAHALRLPSTRIVLLDLSFNYLTGKPCGDGANFYDFSGFDRLCNAILWVKTFWIYFCESSKRTVLTYLFFFFSFLLFFFIFSSLKH